MLRKIEVDNYKSLAKTTLDLGRFNVFIGENGAGKTNLLEAVAFAAAVLNDKADVEELIGRGIRVGPRAMTIGAFRSARKKETVDLRIQMVDDDMAFPPLLVRAMQSNDTKGDWRDPVDPFSEVFGSSTDDPDLTAIGHKFLEIMTLGTRKARRSGEAIEQILAPVFGKSPGLDDKTQQNFVKAWYRLEARHALAEVLLGFTIYAPTTPTLRGLQVTSHRQPLGVLGEDLDVAFAALPDLVRKDVIERAYAISWLKNIVLDPEDRKRREGLKTARSRSRLYFKDRFMAAQREFSAENANEGILYLLFYLTLFSSADTPKIFAVDNIETALNPQLCRDLTAHLVQLAVKHGKQVLVTTHNAAVLDGLNLHDDEQRLFVIERGDAGQTVARRVLVKPQQGIVHLKLSEMWMRGMLGGLPENS